MAEPILPPLVLDGWFVLHQLLRIEGRPFDDEDARNRRARADALGTIFAGWDDLGDDGWSGLYRMVGGGTDYMAVHFRSSLDALGDVERALRLSEAASELSVVHDYVSVVELGLYALTAALVEKAGMDGVEIGSEEWAQMCDEAMEAEREKPYTMRRLRPTQPNGMPYVCFYPMDKRRAVGQNWYTLPVGERADLMADHGRTGRRYAGRISQIITGSVGFDDWEWAVTLFSQDPLHFKSLITEMRYDEVSSVYADFGRFWVGHRIPAAEIGEELAPLD